MGQSASTSSLAVGGRGAWSPERDQHEEETYPQDSLPPSSFASLVRRSFSFSRLNSDCDVNLDHAAADGTTTHMDQQPGQSFAHDVVASLGPRAPPTASDFDRLNLANVNTCSRGSRTSLAELFDNLSPLLEEADGGCAADAQSHSAAGIDKNLNQMKTSHSHSEGRASLSAKGDHFENEDYSTDDNLEDEDVDEALRTPKSSTDASCGGVEPGTNVGQEQQQHHDRHTFEDLGGAIAEAIGQGRLRKVGSGVLFRDSQSSGGPSTCTSNTLQKIPDGATRCRSTARYGHAPPPEATASASCCSSSRKNLDAGAVEHDTSESVEAPRSSLRRLDDSAAIAKKTRPENAEESHNVERCAEVRRANAPVADAEYSLEDEVAKIKGTSNGSFFEEENSGRRAMYHIPSEVWQQIAAFLLDGSFKDLCNLSQACTGTWHAIYHNDHCNSELLWGAIHRQLFENECRDFSSTVSYRDQVLVHYCVRRLLRHALATEDWRALHDVELLLREMHLHDRTRSIIFCKRALAQRPSVRSLRWLWNVANAPASEAEKLVCISTMPPSSQQNAPTHAVRGGRVEQEYAQRRADAKICELRQYLGQFVSAKFLEVPQFDGKEVPPLAAKFLYIADAIQETNGLLPSGTVHSLGGLTQQVERSLSEKQDDLTKWLCYILVLKAVRMTKDKLCWFHKTEPESPDRASESTTDDADERQTASFEDISTAEVVAGPPDATSSRPHEANVDIHKNFDRPDGLAVDEEQLQEGRMMTRSDINSTETDDAVEASPVNDPPPRSSRRARAAVVVQENIAAPRTNLVVGGNEEPAQPVGLGPQQERRTPMLNRHVDNPAEAQWSGLILTWDQERGGATQIESINYPREEKCDEENKFSTVWDDVGYRVECKWNGSRYEGALSDERARSKTGCMVWKTRLLDHFEETKRCRPQEEFVGVFGDRSNINKFGVAFVSR
ncbi:unnamed protein product [Amoebophrya sp. A120]|nr:unnamed protein product [Amoebophrya sp. A120]|eukprot:GSA120T00015116001.1